MLSGRPLQKGRNSLSDGKWNYRIEITITEQLSKLLY